MESNTALTYRLMLAEFISCFEGVDVEVLVQHERGFRREHDGKLTSLTMDVAGDVVLTIETGTDDFDTVWFRNITRIDFGRNDFSTAMCIMHDNGTRYSLIHLK